MPGIALLVDNRERNESLLCALEANGARLSSAQLPVGDYIISDRMCVERKTVPDFENSIIDSRLFDQISRLEASFEKPILVIEGSDGDFRLGKNVMDGAITSLCADYKVQILRTADAEETAYVILKLAEREQGVKERSPKLQGRKKAHDTHEWQVLLLSSIPGVGTKLAEQLLTHFKTVRGVLSAEVDDLMAVDKIGKKKAERIYGIVNSESAVGSSANPRMGGVMREIH